MAVRERTRTTGAADDGMNARAPNAVPPDHPSTMFGAPAKVGSALGGADPDTLYVAFAGRTSGDELQDPTISLPRQLANCRSALPANAVIVSFFWDVESGRKELEARGKGSHDKFDVAMPRDGGLPELLAEAARPDRRFDAVVCESVDRIARLMHQSTRVEHQLERVGVPLFAADEGIETTRRKSTKLLVRRTKQMLAEWYVRQMLELSWDGFCEHTRQGWNVGVPPYGYVGHKVPHPVPHRRDEGLTKTRLVPDPVRGPVVRQIFVWRVTDRLSYAAIAERLNADLDRYPPKRARRPELQRDNWSGSAVREVLENPKYSGYMVWNRRARKTNGGRANPAKDWVWSPAPTHEPLITLDLFRAARAVATARERSRNDPGLNQHPQTKRSYLLRSYVVCAQCQRRMGGKVRKSYTYFVCQPSINHGKDVARRFPGHPPTILVREDALLDGIVSFLAERVLGPGRHSYLRSDVDADSAKAQGDIVRQIEALQKALADIDHKKARLVQRLEDADDVEGSLFADIRSRHKDLSDERDEKLAKLAAATEALASVGVASSVELLDQLPLVDGQTLLGAPEARLRAVFDSLRLRVVYDGATGMAEFRAVVADDTLPAVRGAIAAISRPERPRQGAQAANGARPGPTAAIGRRRGPALTGHDAPADCFPSVWCPRRDSNTRHTV